MAEKTIVAVDAQALFEQRMKPAALVYEIGDEDGAALRVLYTPLSYHRWNEIGAAVKNPDARDYPKFDEKTGRTVPNFDSPAYLAAKQAAEDERLYRRLLESISGLQIAHVVEDGEAKRTDWRDVRIPGGDLSEQVAWLKAARFALLNSLVALMLRHLNVQTAQIEVQAETFQRL